MNRKKKLFIVIVLIFLYIIFNPYLGKKYVNSNIDRNSEWYSNDIYMSDQYYYNNLLNTSEQKIYAILFKGLNNIEPEILVNCDSNTLIKIYDAILMDHPELINITTYTAISTGNNTLTVKPKYLTTSKRKLKRMIAKVQKVITKIEKETRNKSEYEKELYIYEWLGKNNGYKKDYISKSDQSAYSSLVSIKDTVCAGFGKGAQILFQNVGIDSKLLVSSNHMWNLVLIEGDYYYFDATCTYESNCYKTISYSGLNPIDISNSYYNLLYTTSLPIPSGATKYNYFTINDLNVSNIDTFDEVQAIIDKTNKKSEFIEFRLKNHSVSEFSNFIYKYSKKLDELGFSTTYSYIGDIIILKKKL